tara:strand:+ start:183 stop:1280 length:1098 start_codon:yes stop_codon:yes gene_type:complete
MSEELLFIASYDDTIQFCGVDESLGKRFKKIFAEAQGRVITFDPIYTAASNHENLSKLDIWTKNDVKKKRGFGTFDVIKFTKHFIATQKTHLEEPEQNKGMKRNGFDAYAYLMAYEEEIQALYGKNESLTKLQMASLHFVEMHSEIIELDYIRYLATYDDLVLGAVSSKPADKSWEEWLPEVGKIHYTNTGLNEIILGIRNVIPFFDATKYIATHSYAVDSFTDENGKVDTTQVTISFITFGALNGLPRDEFKPNVFLANYPELLAEDIYINKEISPLKVAKIWLDRIKEGIRFDKFDPVDFAEVMGLDAIVDPFESFVSSKLKEYNTMLKKHNGLWYRFTHICGSSSGKSINVLSKPVKLLKKK